MKISRRSILLASSSLFLSKYSDAQLIGFDGVVNAGITSSSATPLSLPTGAIAIYSILRLITWNGNCCQVIRASDSAVKEIGFVKNRIDVASLITFQGASTLTVSKWYDQSGNTNDAVQAIVANQPGVLTSKRYNGCTPIIFNSNNNGSLSSPSIFMGVPAGVSVDQSTCAMFMAGFPRVSGYYDSWFCLTQSSPVIDYFLDPSAVSRTETPNVPPIGGVVVGLNSSPSTLGLWVNDDLTPVSPFGSSTIAGGWLGFLTSVTGYSGMHDGCAVVIYPRTLSGTDVTIVQSAFYQAFGIVHLFSGQSQILCDGDSITEQFGATYNQGWVPTAFKSFPTSKMLNLGVPGQSMTSMTGNVTTKIVSRFSASYSKNIVIVWGGTNDITGGATAASTYTSLQSYTSTAKAAGFKVIWATMLPRTDLSGAAQVQWTAYNTLIRAATLGQSNTADALADVQSNATMGPLAAASNTSLYCIAPDDVSGGIHPTDLGNSLLAPYFVTALGEL